MAYVNHLTTVLPDFKVDQEKVKQVGRSLLKGKVPFLEQALGLFTNAGVDTRYLVCDIDEILANGDLGWRNRVYQKACIELGSRLTEDMLAQTGIGADEIDLIITTSCTGFMIPSVDAHLINRFKMRPDTKRLPLTELGCAAGAMALSRANEYLTAFPTHKVLVLAIELPSLTCQTKDFRVANLVSAALFGDGGVAALLSGVPSNCELLSGQTHFFFDTPNLMGFELDQKGFKIILDKKISDLVLTHFREPMDRFLAAQGWTLDQVRHFVLHPGGRRILDSLKKVLFLDEVDVQISRQVLREVGNLSSASVLWVLYETLKRNPKGPGIMAAFGPGFNAELLAARFHG